MQMNTAHPAGYRIEEPGGYSFTDRIVPYFLPPAHEIISVFADHPAEFGYFVGTVLQVGIHGNDHFSCGDLKPGVQCG